MVLTCWNTSPIYLLYH